jgi:type III secretion protein D
MRKLKPSNGSIFQAKVADVKRIRILTGAHAGAQISLTVGTYRVGAHDACDICISDWAEEELTLIVDESFTVRMLMDADQAADGAGALVPDFVALRFGDATLCIGPEDTTWPSDLDLLSGMLALKGEADVPAPHAKRTSLKLTGIGLASMMVASAVVAGTIIFGTQTSEAVPPAPNLGALAAKLTRSLHAIGLQELNAKAIGNAVLVQGMVPTADEDIAARKLIARIGGEHVQRGYDVAQDDARSLQESLAIAGAHASYAGNGVFRISGTVPSLEAYQQALADVRQDFDANVKKIESNVREGTNRIPPVSYSSMVSIGDVRYIETPDGVKHVYPASHQSLD